MTHQVLPRAGAEREALREKGQFWTPDWVADAMVRFVGDGGATTVFDPAVGGGAFLVAAKRVWPKAQLAGCELFPEVLDDAKARGLTATDLSGVEHRNFVLDPPGRRFEAIVANPPYVRHHRLPPDDKAALQAMALEVCDERIDGRAGLHVYFLIRALSLLVDGGRLAFILPADAFEGVFSSRLWRWVGREFRIHGVVTFAPKASPFPGVDTNAVIVCIGAEPPSSQLSWVRCDEAGGGLCDVVTSGFVRGNASCVVTRRALEEALEIGLSREPVTDPVPGRPLSDYARVVRGIATGANEFFFLTDDERERFGLPREMFVRAVGRTRDAPTDVFDQRALDELVAVGRPTWLLYLNGGPRDRLPTPVQQYLLLGEAQGLHKRSLLKTRRPWYRMERREPPPILFAYLGRRNSRFLRNRAGVLPLTGFLCIYPHDPAQSDALWRALNEEGTLAGLRLVAKSYGGGALKVEPRGLERLTIPATVAERVGLVAG